MNIAARARSRIGVGLLLAAIVVAGACGGSGSAKGGSALEGGGGTTAPSGGDSKPISGGTLRMVHVSNPSSLDPHTGGSGGDHVSLYPLYDRLVNFSADKLEPQPGLAESWNYPDPLTLVLNLRQGVTFQDGTPFNADAVKYNLDRAKTLPKSTVKAETGSISSVDVTGPYTVTAHLSRPDSALILILADRAGMMVSPTAAAAAGDGFAQHPVGTGPFSFVEWRPGDRLVLKKNPNYWQAGKPYLDGISIRYLTDSQTGNNALLADEADFKTSVEPADVDNLKRQSGIVVSSAPSLFVDMCYGNFGSGPWTDVRFRQAVNYAIDRSAMNAALLFGEGSPAAQIVPEKHWAYQTNLANPWPHDAAKAKQLLAQAGLTGTTLRVLSPDGPGYQRRDEVMQAQLKEVGINMTIDIMETGASAKSFFEGLSHDMYCSGWSGRPDPNQSMSSIYSSKGYFNAGKYVAPKLDELIAAAAASPDIPTRAKAYGPLTSAIQEQALTVPIEFRPSINGMRSRVKGFEPNLYGKPDVSFLWIKQ
jgi:ABC-type transport system substrate-binding protein